MGRETSSPVYTTASIPRPQATPTVANPATAWFYTLSTGQGWGLFDLCCVHSFCPALFCMWILKPSCRQLSTGEGWPWDSVWVAFPNIHLDIMVPPLKREEPAWGWFTNAFFFFPQCANMAQPSANFWSRERAQSLANRLDSPKVFFYVSTYGTMNTAQ